MTSSLNIIIYSAFIIAIFCLSSPKIAYKGNFIAIFAMLFAIIINFISLPPTIQLKTLIPLLLGALTGTTLSLKIKLKELPQIIALLNGFGGLSSLLIGISSFLLQTFHPFFLIFIILLGSITFFGSLASFIKLKTTLSLKHPQFYKTTSVILLLFTLLFSYFTPNLSLPNLLFITFLSSLFGFLFILPIGGADMPIIISLLNSLSGWTTVLIGLFTKNTLLIITGTLIGASGTILSYIMLKYMNKKLLTVLFSSPTKQPTTSSLSNIHQTTPKDVAFLLENATNIIIVPGFGLASSNAEHLLKTLDDILTYQYHTNIKYAIHPVAGRMPGHLNIILAEAEINDSSIFELKDINKDFKTTDIALVIGANDITNPIAKTDPTSPIYQMPILEVENASKIIFIKRSLSPGYSGIDNPLFYEDKTLMLLGDAKEILKQIIKELESSTTF